MSQIYFTSVTPGRRGKPSPLRTVRRRVFLDPERRVGGERRGMLSPSCTTPAHRVHVTSGPSVLSGFDFDLFFLSASRRLGGEHFLVERGESLTRSLK